MKKLFLVLSVFVLLVPLMSVTAQSSTLTETYVDPDGAYAFDHPSGWRIVAGDLGLDLGIPNLAASPSISFYRGDDPVDLVEDLLFVDGEPEEIPLGDKTGAKFVKHEAYSSMGFYAVEYATNKLAVVTIFAAKWQIERYEPVFLALLETVRVPTDEELAAAEPEADAAEALELGATYEDTNITFDYPAEWYSLAYQGKIALSNVRGLAQYREAEFIYLNPEQVVVIIFPRTDTLPGIVQAILDENDDTAYDIALTFGIDVLVEANTINFPEPEEIEVNRQDAAFMSFAGESEDYMILAIELENGEIATLLMVTEAGEMHLYENTFMAIAETLVGAE